MISTSIISEDFTKIYGTPDQLTATLKAGNTYLVGYTLRFTINGVAYDRTTDSTGTARLNINLPVGYYLCGIFFAGDSTYSSSSNNSNVSVESKTVMETSDLKKRHTEVKEFECKVVNCYGNPVEGNVTFKVNGVTYVRAIEDGVARLTIRLGTGNYTITSSYEGNAFNTSETRTNKIIVIPDTDSITSLENGVTLPPDNRGFMESKIFLSQFTPEFMKEGNYLNPAPNWELKNNLKNPIQFTSYEITETDPRVKTAKFTTPQYFDLTNGVIAVLISSPYHENFGGIVLKVDYDKSTKLYTYQCQDGRREYVSKTRTINNGTPNAYDILESLLVHKQYTQSKYLSIPIPEDVRQRYSTSLSGLRPIDEYNIKFSPVSTPTNNLKNTYPKILSYDSIIDKIMSIAHVGQTPIDVHFTTDLICQIEPIDLDRWVKEGLKLVHSDLIHYKYNFDTTNIITRVSVKDNNATNMTDYQDWNELRFYFGQIRTIIDPVTTSSNTQTTTSSSGNGSSLMSGKKTFVVGADNINGNERSYINTVISKLQGKGHSTVNVGVGPSAIQNYGLKSASKGKIAVFIVGGSDAGMYSDFVAGLKRGYYHYDHMIVLFASNTATTDKWLTCNGLANTKLVRAHDDNYSKGTIAAVGKTAKQYFNENSQYISYVCGPKGCTFDSVATKLVNGNFGSDSNSTTNVTSTNTSTSTNNVLNTTKTYEKALEEVSNSIRDLLSFEIRVPLNSTLFKNLHTNQMLFTELPQEFKLGNLEKIFKILPSYKVNRGVAYQENRWYVEKVTTKMDSSGLFADIVLNVFPSSYSVYANAVTSYAEAYDQAFNSSSNITSANNSTLINNGAALGNPLLGNDCTSTNSMAAMSGGGYGNSGHGKNFDSAATKGYANQNANYYNWARQYTNVKALLHALASKFHYSSYSGNQKCPQKMFNSGAIYGNCYDACRLVKVCCDSCGFPCVVITGSIWQGGHGWNAVKWNGTWYTFDLCYTAKEYSTKATNSFRSVW